MHGGGVDFVVALVPRGAAWKLAPSPSFKFQPLEGAAAEQTVRYALLHDFVATPLVADSAQVASLLAPRNPTPSGSTLNFLPRVDTAGRTFDVEVLTIAAGAGAAAAGGAAGGGGGAGAR